MPTTRAEFVTLDVFTKTPYKGNPLSIVLLPPPTPTSPALTQKQKQDIAREFNLSETVFVHGVDPKEDTEPHTRRIDIFMTTIEIPFGGHPTIGTASYLWSKGITKLITKAGPIPISSDAGVVSALVPHDTHLHSKTLASLGSDSHVGLHHITEIRDAELNAPLFSPMRGIAFALVQLPSLDLLSHVCMGPLEFKPLLLLDDSTWNNAFMARSYFVITGSDVFGSVRTITIRTRMIAPTSTHLHSAIHQKAPSLLHLVLVMESRHIFLFLSSNSTRTVSIQIWQTHQTLLTKAPE